ncbi:prothoracicotropic hormone-like [Phymastichus coffea]|uniref:prothoracicotropic hormone-like n=1 Tax=Phymastichus coffea TaxID=108790 RepID=UPI00273C631C|nr:prothoracicotropic hormone-like [Phymastichus coffea]
MKLFVLLVMILATGPGRRMSIGRCGADDFSEPEFPFDREDCADGSTYPEKRLVVPGKLREHHPAVSRLQAMSAQDLLTQWKPICGCVAEHRVINLGEGHYPRYITIAKCRPKTCSNRFYQCRHTDYRLHVLVNRGMNSILNNAQEMGVKDLEELTLPQSLQANWQMIGLSIPVACTSVERT